jgi:integrase
VLDDGVDATKPLPAPIADLGKAYVLIKRFERSHTRAFALVLGYLWAAIAKRTRDYDARQFRWEDVRASDFVDAEREMLERTDETTVAGRVGTLAAFARWLADPVDPGAGLCPGLQWEPETPTTSEARLRTPKGRALRAKRMPTRRAIEGLAEVYRKRDLLSAERLLICAVGLLLVSALRISELLSLPLDCWVTEEYKGRERVGLRYWKRKSRNGRYKHHIRWLSPLGAWLARDLLDEILRLTAGARRQAAALARDRGQVLIPNADRATGIVGARAVQHALGIKARSLDGMARDGRLPFRAVGRSAVGKGRPLLFPLAEVEAYATSKLETLVGFNPGRGSEPQLLADTLLIGFHGAFTTPLRGTERQPKQRAQCSALLVERLAEHHVRTFLGGVRETEGDEGGPKRTTRESVFARHGITEPPPPFGGTGEVPRMHPHMARHWIQTLAHLAGMGAFLITKWLGKTNERHTQAYLHELAAVQSPEDLADLLQGQMAEGRVAGVKADFHDHLPEADRERFRAGIGPVHKVPGGYCAELLRVTGCRASKACLAAACPSYLVLLDDEQDAAAILEGSEAAVLGLAVLNAAERQGVRVHPRQRQLAENTIRSADAFTARRRGVNAPDGTGGEPAAARPTFPPSSLSVS